MLDLNEDIFSLIEVGDEEDEAALVELLDITARYLMQVAAKVPAETRLKLLQRQWMLEDWLLDRRLIAPAFDPRYLASQYGTTEQVAALADPEEIDAR